jgi:hypothetical protein
MSIEDRERVRIPLRDRLAARAAQGDQKNPMADKPSGGLCGPEGCGAAGGDGGIGAGRCHRGDVHEARIARRTLGIGQGGSGGFEEIETASHSVTGIAKADRE